MGNYTLALIKEVNLITLPSATFSGGDNLVWKGIPISFEALPGVLGNGGIRPFISGEQGNKILKLKGKGDQMELWGTENIENKDFDLGEQEKMPIV